MPSIYGQGEYGVDSFSSDIQNLKGINRIYVGCEKLDGREANAIFDEMQLFFVEKSDAEIASLFNSTQESTWTMNHQLLAHFNNSLDAGNLFLNQYTVSYWRIYRKKSNENQYKLIGTVTNDDNVEILETSDFEVANNTSYDYAIEGISDSGVVSNKYEVTNSKLDFSGIWLVDKNTGNLFVFRYNINAPRPDTTFTTESDRNETKTFSRFPIVRRGVSKFERGTLECAILENEISLYEQEQNLKSMEGSDNLLLKFDTGHMYKVDIHNITPTYITETDNTVATVKCDWVQTGEVK